MRTRVTMVRCASVVLLFTGGTLSMAWAQSGQLQLPFAPEKVAVPQPLERPFDLVGPKRKGGSGTSARRLARTSDALLSAIEETERIQNERLRRIREKLARLKALAESCRVQDETPEPTTPKVTNPPTLEPILPKATGGPSAQQANVQPDPPKATTVPVSITSAVDLLALANNLFAQGKSTEARPLYEDLLATPQTANDLIWIQYQLASCYRLEGNHKEASRLYRVVAASQGAEYWSSRALWWLDYLQRTKAVLERQQGLKAKLEALRKETHALHAS